MKGEPATWSASPGVLSVMNFSTPGKCGSSLVRPSSVVPWLSGGDTDERVDLVGAAEELQVVVRHHAALGVADEVRLRGSGGVEHLVDERVELLGGLVDGAEPVEERHPRELAVVEGEDAVAPVDQVGGEDEPVVDRVPERPVDQDDGAGVRGGGLAAVVVPAARGGRRGGGRGGRRGDEQGEGEKQGGEQSARAGNARGTEPGQHRVVSLRLKGGAMAVRPVARTTSFKCSCQITHG